MIYTIEEIRDKAVPVAMRYGVRNLRLFGSYARGEANAQSDVDLRIDRGNLTGLFSYFAMVEDLERALGCHVDLVLDDSQDQEFLKRIQREEVQLYAAQ
ncbi:MAG: nucleotidyltransferase domain-containing protein [Clostridia bacterium]|nr:nucleotidyltransferase domain-containing protein [Clostridia bacterium]